MCQEIRAIKNSYSSFLVSKQLQGEGKRVHKGFSTKGVWKSLGYHSADTQNEYYHNIFSFKT